MPICAVRNCHCFLESKFMRFYARAMNAILIRTYYVNRVCKKWQDKRRRRKKKLSETTSNDENPCFIYNSTWHIVLECIMAHITLTLNYNAKVCVPLTHTLQTSCKWLNCHFGCVAVRIKWSCSLVCYFKIQHFMFCCISALINFTFCYSQNRHCIDITQF